MLLLVELLQPSLISAHLIRMLTRWADMHWQVYVVRTSALYILKQLLSFEASPNENNLQHHFDHFNTDYTAFGNNVLITCIPPLAKQGGERWSTAELKYSTFTHRVSGYMAFFVSIPLKTRFDMYRTTNRYVQGDQPKINRKSSIIMLAAKAQISLRSHTV